MKLRYIRHVVCMRYDINSRLYAFASANISHGVYRVKDISQIRKNLYVDICKVIPFNK